MKFIALIISLVLAACGLGQTLDIKPTNSGSEVTTKDTVTIYRMERKDGVVQQTIKVMPASTPEERAAVVAQRGFRTINLAKVSVEKKAALARAELSEAQLNARQGIAAEFPPGAFYQADYSDIGVFTSHTERITQGHYDPDPMVWKGVERVRLPHEAQPLLGWMVFKKRSGIKYYRFGYVDENEDVVGLSTPDPATGKSKPLFYTEVWSHPQAGGKTTEAYLNFGFATNATRCKNHFPTVTLSSSAFMVERPTLTKQVDRYREVVRTLTTTVTTTVEKTVRVNVPQVPNMGGGIFIAFNGYSQVNDSQQIRTEMITMDLFFFSAGCRRLPKTVCDDGWAIDWDNLPGSFGDTGPNPWLGGDTEWGPPPPRGG